MSWNYDGLSAAACKIHSNVCWVTKYLLSNTDSASSLRRAMARNGRDNLGVDVIPVELPSLDVDTADLAGADVGDVALLTEK